MAAVGFSYSMASSLPRSASVSASYCGKTGDCGLSRVGVYLSIFGLSDANSDSGWGGARSPKENRACLGWSSLWSVLCCAWRANFDAAGFIIIYKSSAECQRPAMHLLHEDRKQRRHGIADNLFKRILGLLARLGRHELLIRLPQS